jgi:heptaprenyl diphosphate synthase
MGTVASGAEESTTAQAAGLVALLGASMRADASVHGLCATAEPPVTDAGNAVAALAGAWLAAKANELSAELGDEPFERCSAAAARITRGWMIETEDLYDAGRPPARCLEATECLSGGIFELACGLGGWAAGATAERRQALQRFGGELGVAIAIRDEYAALSADGEALARGVYSLPVACALEADPSLASSLGGAIQPEALPELALRIGEAGGQGTANHCTAHADRARAAVSGLDGTDSLAAVAAEVDAECKRAVGA